jgi:hypothetical protein
MNISLEEDNVADDLFEEIARAEGSASEEEGEDDDDDDDDDAAMRY